MRAYPTPAARTPARVPRRGSGLAGLRFTGAGANALRELIARLKRQ